MLPLTPDRIREVSCRRLKEDVEEMMVEIRKHFPKKE